MGKKVRRADDSFILCASLPLFKVPIVKERRRFTDVMEEEATIKRETKLEAWGRDDFSVYKPARMLGEVGGGGEGAEEIVQEMTIEKEASSVRIRSVPRNLLGIIAHKYWVYKRIVHSQLRRPQTFCVTFSSLKLGNGIE